MASTEISPPAVLQCCAQTAIRRRRVLQTRRMAQRELGIVRYRECSQERPSFQNHGNRQMPS